MMRVAKIMPNLVSRDGKTHLIRHPTKIAIHTGPSAVATKRPGLRGAINEHETIVIHIFHVPQTRDQCPTRISGVAKVRALRRNTELSLWQNIVRDRHLVPTHLEVVIRIRRHHVIDVARVHGKCRIIDIFVVPPNGLDQIVKVFQRRIAFAIIKRRCLISLQIIYGVPYAISRDEARRAGHGNRRNIRRRQSGRARRATATAIRSTTMGYVAFGIVDIVGALENGVVDYDILCCVTESTSRN
mmetsp:Transcript_48730/g.58978  ORF Transcript_48730/g.58978 Transcript_48730/m.58978 type:complete len:243 (+) Transcript_48730:2366-3094(+)